MLTGMTSLIRRAAQASNERAVANARAATTEASRRRVEHTEVGLYLAALADDGRNGAGPAASAAAEHPA